MRISPFSTDVTEISKARCVSLTVIRLENVKYSEVEN